MLNRNTRPKNSFSFLRPPMSSIPYEGQDSKLTNLLTTKKMPHFHFTENKTGNDSLDRKLIFSIKPNFSQKVNL